MQPYALSGLYEIHDKPAKCIHMLFCNQHNAIERKKPPKPKIFFKNYVTIISCIGIQNTVKIETCNQIF